MASTNLDGSNMMILNEGTLVTLVIGDKSYMGTLKMRTAGFQESWYIVPDDGGDEIEIHKRESVSAVVKAPFDPNVCKDGGAHESIMGSEFCLKCGEPL